MGDEGEETANTGKSLTATLFGKMVHAKARPRLPCGSSGEERTLNDAKEAYEDSSRLYPMKHRT